MKANVFIYSSDERGLMADLLAFAASQAASCGNGIYSSLGGCETQQPFSSYCILVYQTTTPRKTANSVLTLTLNHNTTAKLEKFGEA